MNTSLKDCRRRFNSVPGHHISKQLDRISKIPSVRTQSVLSGLTATRLSRAGVSKCRTPKPGSSPNAAAANRASDSNTQYTQFKIAFGGLAASLDDPVSGETRVPKVRQCSGTRGRSFLGKLMGKCSTLTSMRGQLATRSVELWMIRR